MRAEMIKHKIGKIVMRAEHEIRNYCSQNCAELKSGFQFNRAINNK